MMTTRQDIRRAAKRVGAEVIVHREGPLDLEVVAPDGHHWQGEDVHALVACQHPGERVGEVYDDLLSRMRGVEPCCRESRNCRDWNGWPE